MSLLERIATHAVADQRRRLSVPEWGDEGKPLIVTYSLVTLDDLSFINTMDGSTEFNVNAARIVALKALDEDGNRLFKTADATELRTKAAPEVVKTLALAMLGRSSVDDAEKN